jgi:hypothetical protein
MQPLVDTANVGLSYLDTVLQARARDGVVAKTSSRLFLVGRIARGTPPRDVADFFRAFFTQRESDATGLVMVQPASMWALVECSPEAAAGLMRAVAAELSSSAAAAGALRWPAAGARRGGADSDGVDQAPAASSFLVDARVVAQTEDCPHRLFDALYCQAAAPAAETVPDLENENPALLSAALYRAVVAVGYAVRRVWAGPAGPGALAVPASHQAGAAAAGNGVQGAGECADFVARLADASPVPLPSDERCAAVAGLSKVRKGGRG